ncbi:MAG: response regulator [Candidatus Omnitrophota bacterium]
MRKPLILVVDDEKEVRSTIVEYLGLRYDCDFFEAENGEDAVNFVRKNTCDMLILDIKMPKKSGITVIKEVKEIKPDIDILIVSSWSSDDVAEETMELGATDYVLKPLNLNVISIKFEDILKRRGISALKK